MSTAFLVSLAGVVAAILGARVLVDALPLRHVAVAVARTDLVLLGAGLVGLAFHCGAMFYPAAVHLLPRAGAVISQIDALQTVSIILFAVPAVLLLLGLRRQHPVAPTVEAVALAAVGVTMYDGGSLSAHLAAIFASVVILAGIAATLMQPAPRRRPAVSQR